MLQHSTNKSLALTTSAATTDALVVSEYQSGGIFIPTGSPITTLTYHAVQESAGDYLPAYDAAGVAIVQTVSGGKAYAMPAALFGFALLKIVVNAAGSVKVSLKG